MPENVYHLHGTTIFELDPAGPSPRSARDATDWLSSAWSHKASLLVIPAARLDDDFFRLKTGVAGEIIQKLVTYRMRVAIIGDITRQVETSSSLRDFVYECNQGPNVWFLPDLQALESRLAQSE